MTLFLALLIAQTLAAVLLMAFLVRRHSLRTGLPVTSEWLEDLSLDRYQPMLRMGDPGDLQILRQQPGFTWRRVFKFRMQRAQLVRGYLRSLDTDFARVCAAIHIMLLQSPQDRPDCMRSLFRQQIVFTCSLLIVRMRLWLYSWGVGVVDVAHLVKRFYFMQMELCSLTSICRASA
jgi:hypothetical protein